MKLKNLLPNKQKGCRKNLRGIKGPAVDRSDGDPELQKTDWIGNGLD